MFKAMFYAVFEGDSEYVKEVMLSGEYTKRFGGLDDMYQPRTKMFPSREEAENYMGKHNQVAREYYSESARR